MNKIEQIITDEIYPGIAREYQEKLIKQDHINVHLTIGVIKQIANRVFESIIIELPGGDLE